MVLQVNQLVKTYKNKVVLQNISFEIKQGELIGLVGPNGAGKSTLMRSIMGLEEVKSGTIQIHSISHNNPDFFKSISFLPSDNYLYMQLTGYDHLSFIASIYKLSHQDIEDVIEVIGIGSYVNHPVKSYSYGMRQHLLIALSILTKPMIILMDEPFNGLDPTSIIELKHLIRTLHAKGISLMISTHNLDILEDLTDTIWFIKEGKLFKNNMESTRDVRYQIKFAFDGDLAQVMKGSHLPFELNQNRLITDSAYAIEDYLQCLLKHGVGILSVSPTKQNLEKLYRKFYDV